MGRIKGKAGNTSEYGIHKRGVVLIQASGFEKQWLGEIV
jgi:hypothetical protein